MQAQELLIAIAQIAVALAGFSGLIAAIRTAAPEGWHPRDVWSLSWMLGASIGALLFALLPAWLALFGMDEAGVYRIASALVCVSPPRSSASWRLRGAASRGAVFRRA